MRIAPFLNASAPATISVSGGYSGAGIFEAMMLQPAQLAVASDGGARDPSSPEDCQSAQGIGDEGILSSAEAIVSPDTAATCSEDLPFLPGEIAPDAGHVPTTKFTEQSISLPSAPFTEQPGGIVVPDPAIRHAGEIADRAQPTYAADVALAGQAVFSNPFIPAPHADHPSSVAADETTASRVQTQEAAASPVAAPSAFFTAVQNRQYPPSAPDFARRGATPHPHISDAPETGHMSGLPKAGHRLQALAATQEHNQQVTPNDGLQMRIYAAITPEFRHDAMPVGPGCSQEQNMANPSGKWAVTPSGPHSLWPGSGTQIQRIGASGPAEDLNITLAAKPPLPDAMVPANAADMPRIQLPAGHELATRSSPNLRAKHQTEGIHPAPELPNLKIRVSFIPPHSNGQPPSTHPDQPVALDITTSPALATSEMDSVPRSNEERVSTLSGDNDKYGVLTGSALSGKGLITASSGPLLEASMIPQDVVSIEPPAIAAVHTAESPGPASQQAAPHGNGMTPTRQLAEAIVFPGPKHGGTELTLSPEELGKVQFSIRNIDGQLTIVVVAERPETMALLRRNADQLAAELAQSGMGDAALDFGGGGQAGDQSARSSHILVPTTERTGDTPIVQPFGEPTQNTRGTFSGGRVDIRL